MKSPRSAVQSWRHGIHRGNRSAQYLRRCAHYAIYEGTNGIQSIDLVNPKTRGRWRRVGLGPARRAVWQRQTGRGRPTTRVRHQTGAKLRDALDRLDRSSRWLLERVTSAPNDALAGREPYSPAVRIDAGGGCMLAGEALPARRPGEGAGDPCAMSRWRGSLPKIFPCRQARWRRTVRRRGDALQQPSAAAVERSQRIAQLGAGGAERRDRWRPRPV